MTTFLIVISVLIAWLVGAFFVWALIHGAQILRRQEVAALIAAEQEHAGRDEADSADATDATVISIIPDDAQLQSAA
ncbi:hypothetical protein IV500_04725 [Paeniglutamicibacter antarcticus]|uniref:Uncharacterized protein n=1 Tax=Arthrobacter terrae TaxID=2935737 RepID=A0A931CKN4_9MICC|nr:hypothetical protein [Arthrobacter terrae]MBG0738722.1 hypothetical protein [Arthrobacter terrae]